MSPDKHLSIGPHSQTKTPGGNMSDVGVVLRKTNKKLEEQHLIDLALKGDEAAFAKLYNRYHNRVYAFCSRLLRGKHDVEDAVQQVFLEAWRSMGRFEGRS